MEDDPLRRSDVEPASYIPQPAIDDLMQQQPPPRHDEELPPPPPTAALAAVRRLRIVVTTPQKAGDGVTAHYVWQVSTTDLDTARHSSVRRRFNDWLFLRDELNHCLPGSILPPMPSRDPVKGKLAPEDFMEERRQGLQAFLAAVAQHSRLARLPALQQFLEATDAEWTAVHEKAAARAAPDGGGLAESAQSMIRWVRTRAQGWQNSYTDSGRAMVGESDPSFEQTSSYVDALHHQLSALHGRAQNVAANRRDAGFVQSALADDLRALARTGRGSGAESGLADAGGGVGASAAVALDHTADACARLASATGPTVSEISAAAQTVERMASEVIPVQEAVQYRAGLLAAWQTCQADVASAAERQNQAHAGGNALAAQAAQQAREQASALEADARQRYDGCVATMREELRSYDERREAELRRALRGYLVAQLAAAEQTAKIYQEALDKIDSASAPPVEVGRSSAGS
jgi:sorting nexin-1/2